MCVWGGGGGIVFLFFFASYAKVGCKFCFVCVCRGGGLMFFYIKIILVHVCGWLFGCLVASVIY